MNTHEAQRIDAPSSAADLAARRPAAGQQGPHVQRCWTCDRFALLARGIVLAASALLVVASTPSGPAWAADPLPTLPAAPASAGSPPLQLVFRQVMLPSAQVGRPYGRVLAAGGSGPYRLDASDGPLPPGLMLSPDGTLSGVPTARGRYPFTLRVADQVKADGVLQQAYVLVVNPPAGAVPAARASASAPAAEAVVSPEALNLPSDRSDEPRALVWKLTLEDIQKLLPDEPALTEVPSRPADASAAASTPATAGSAPAAQAKPAAAAAAAAAEAPWPTADLLAQRLAPLLDIEYPTRAMFESALAVQLRKTCREIVARATRQALRKLPEQACRDDPKAPAPAASAALTPEQTYQALLPPSLRSKLMQTARKSHAFTEGAPLLWRSARCPCSPAQAKEQVYGLLPFWAATAKGERIDFSAFTRIGVLGKFMRDDGGLAGSPHWDDQSAGGLQVARQHGTALDLVLYRNEWPRLLALPDAQREQMLSRAAKEAVASVDTPIDGLYARTTQWLLTGWPEPRRLYGGLTVFFDFEPEALGTAAQAAEGMRQYRQFYRAFILQLIAEMERTGHDYRLNLVVPDHLMVAGSAYSVEDLLDYMLRTGSLPSSRPADARQVDHAARRGAIQTQLLVLLREPTTDTKKALRERMDHNDALQSHVRAEFLESLLPVMVYPRSRAPAAASAPAAGEGGKPAAVADGDDAGAAGNVLSGGEAFQFDADMAYYKWQFGGLALWPVPAAGQGSSDVVSGLLRNNFRAKSNWFAEQADALVCSVVCAHRTEARLLWRALLLFGAITIGVYLGVCRVRSMGPVTLKLGPLQWTIQRMGTWYRVMLVVGGAVTVLVFAALLNCDPDLVALKEGNSLLGFGVVALLGWLLYRASQRGVAVP